MRSLIKNVVALATCHWLSMVGVAVVTGSAVVFVSLSLLPFDNPYLGILLFLTLPSFFALGLVLIPIGIRQKAKQMGGYRQLLTPLEWREGTVLRLLIVLGGGTAINVVLLSSVAWQGTEYLGSDEFCGTTCHSVMEPQYSAYQESAHAEAGCVSCHVGTQASSFLYHKVDGLRQVFELVNSSYDRPIPSSGGRMHSADETCGNCHRLGTWTNEPDKLRVIRSYADDEASTDRITALLLPLERIHEAHAPNTIEYLAVDETLQVIPWVRVEDVEYVAGERPEGEVRSMDCTDCHNRAGHDFGTLEAEVDHAIRRGQLDRSTPYARRDAILALNGELPMSDAPESVRAIEAGSVFPNMAITWNTYPSNIGHESAQGCFRCHDSAHENSQGDVLSQNCTSCHALLAIQEERPEVLRRLGIAE